tara:strand:- start:3349 stop:4071 length:723 start_codon:yes stop_codon:yes gene_type:complete
MKFNFYNKKYTLTRPRLIPFIAFVLALSILLSLSTWQFKRLKWKTGLINERITKFESEIVPLENFKNTDVEEFQRIKVVGALQNKYELFMPALSKNGNNGYHILTILKTRNSNIIYDTGWVPLNKKEIENRKENLITGEQSFNAVIRLPGRKGRFQPDNDLEDNFWFFVDPLQIEEFTDLKVEKNFYLEAVNNGPNGFPLGNQTRIYLRNNHLQYALTWLMIAVGLIGVFVAANIKKVKK